MPPLAGLLLVAGVAAQDARSVAEDDWPAADDTDTTHVNEGALEVFTEPPSGGPFHHHHNRLLLLRDSLDTGWVRVNQCHRQLDRVPRLEVTFRPGRVRALEVVEALNIGRAWVDGDSVQLADVGPGARLCLKGELRMILPDGPGRYLLRSGPYMRRFLDGYYPMRVDVELDVGQSAVRIGSIRPAPRPGLEVVTQGSKTRIGALFAGRLLIEVELAQTEPR